MRLIDAQGRFFGRWNSLDVILLGATVLALVFGVASGLRWAFRMAAPLPMRTFDVDVVLASSPHGAPPAIGEDVLDRKGKPIGQVFDVWGSSDVGVTVRFTVPVKGELLKVDGKLVGPVSPVVLRTAHATYEGSIKWISTKPLVWTQALIRSSGVLSEVALIMQEGDFQRNAYGRVVARISKIHSNDVARDPVLISTGSEGGMIKLMDAHMLSSHEILLSMDLLVSQEARGYVFSPSQEKPLKVGQELLLETEAYTFRGRLLQLTSRDGQPLLPVFTPALPYETRLVWVQARFGSIPEELAKLVKPGDEERKQDGEVLARVERVLFSKFEQEPTLRILVDDADEPNVFYQDRVPSYSMVVILRLSCQVRDEVIFYQGQQLRYGSMIEVQAHRYKLRGRVIRFLSDPQQADQLREVQREVTVLSAPLLPEVASLIRVGDHDEMVTAEPSIEVLEVISIEPAKSPIQLGVDLERVRLRFRIRCVQQGSACLYAGQPVKAGSALIFTSPRYDFSGIVLSVNPVGE